MKEEFKLFNLKKKGAMPGFNIIPTLLLALLIAGVIGAVSSLITTEFTSSLSGISNTLNNQSVTMSGGTAYLPTTGSNGPGGRSYSVSSVNNVSNNTIGSNNYAVNATFGDFRFLAGANTASQHASDTINISFSYITDSNTQQILQNATFGTKRIFEQFGTVGTVIGVMLILMTILFFMGRRVGKGAV